MNPHPESDHHQKSITSLPMSTRFDLHHRELSCRQMDTRTHIHTGHITGDHNTSSTSTQRHAGR